MQFSDGAWYSGRVRRASGGKVDIQFDDGDYQRAVPLIVNGAPNAELIRLPEGLLFPQGLLFPLQGAFQVHPVNGNVCPPSNRWKQWRGNSNQRLPLGYEDGYFLGLRGG